MAEATKYAPINGGNMMSEFRGFFSVPRSKRTTTFAYGFVFAFILFTIFLAFGPSSNSSSPWFTNVFASSNSSSVTTPVFSEESYRSQFSSIFSYFFPNTTAPVDDSRSRDTAVQSSTTQSADLSGEGGELSPNQTAISTPESDFSDEDEVFKPNQSTIGTPKSDFSSNVEVLKPNQTTIGTPKSDFVGKVDGLKPNQTTVAAPPAIGLNPNQTTVDAPPATALKPNQSTVGTPPVIGLKPNQSAVDALPKTALKPNQTTVGNPPVIGLKPNQSTIGAVNSPAGGNSSANLVPSTSGSEEKRVPENSTASNFPSLLKKDNNETSVDPSVKNPVEDLLNCNLFDGHWVRDESYPLYNPGSCPLIDEQFNCFINGRPDSDYYKLKWKPKGCSLPRLNGTHMLELLRGKRLVFVGDSLNRNMWESLVCILRSTVKDHSKVYEASGRHNFRSEPSYSFVFKDYGATVEFFVSPFLVQEWEVPDKNGTEKETLRLDLIGRAANQYKDADILIFNTGHWWTHEKTSKGKDYYQEGSHVYNQLNVIEAFRKALTTWARWVDANVNAIKTMVLFRGYSASHFSGGQWNSGGACDSETEPIKNETYLEPYPPKMYVLENVLKAMKTHVSYLNITRITDYRKDGHPSVYRKQKQHVPEAERKSPLRFQDCSHWCLPGVPDAWNELLYAEILIRQHQKQQSQKKP